MKKIGVYTISIVGTRYVYVGEAMDVGRRWTRHLNEWVWPNVADFRLVYDMPDSTRKERQRVEGELMRKLEAEGHFVVGVPTEEMNSLKIRRANAVRTPEQRRAITNAARASVTQGSIEKRRASMLAACKRRTPEMIAAKSAKIQASWRNPEVRAKRIAGIRAARGAA